MQVFFHDLAKIVHTSAAGRVGGHGLQEEVEVVAGYHHARQVRTPQRQILPCLCGFEQTQKLDTEHALVDDTQRCFGFGTPESQCLDEPYVQEIFTSFDGGPFIAVKDQMCLWSHLFPMVQQA